MISQIVVFPFDIVVKPRNIMRQSFVCSVGSILACVAWRFCRAGRRSSNLLAVSLPSPAFIT